MVPRAATTAAAKIPKYRVSRSFLLCLPRRIQYKLACQVSGAEEVTTLPKRKGRAGSPSEPGTLDDQQGPDHPRQPTPVRRPLAPCQPPFAETKYLTFHTGYVQEFVLKAANE